jgi:hypothetical protein
MAKLRFNRLGSGYFSRQDSGIAHRDCRKGGSVFGSRAVEIYGHRWRTAKTDYLFLITNGKAGA